MLAAFIFQRSLMKLRFLYIALLLFSPILIYGTAIFTEYGFRDDYSITREAHEEPGKTLGFTASHGRPLYGVFLETGFSLIRNVSDLAWLRLVSAVLITGFGLLLYRQLKINGWESFESASVALIVMFLPAAQVTISWTVGWPWGIALMLTVLGFGLAEVAWTQTGYARGWRLLVVVMAYMLSTAIYQSDTLAAILLLASVLLAPRHLVDEKYIFDKKKMLQRCFFHLSILFVALMLSYGFLQLLFMEGIFHASGRLQFETDVVSKVIWFLSQSLPNALAFLTLRDDFATGVVSFWIMVAAVTSFIVLALCKQIQKKNMLNWWLCLLLLPWIAHGISLVAAERVLGYRTTFALSGLVVVVLVASIREVIPGAFRYLAISLLVVASAIQAYEQSYHLIAEPQAREWNMLKDAVAKMQPGVATVIFLIEPKPADRSTDRVYRDEFGSFTSNSEWAPKEMFKAAMHQRFSGGIPADWHYEFYHGGDPPPPTEHYDQVIDVRTLKQWRK